MLLDVEPSAQQRMAQHALSILQDGGEQRQLEQAEELLSDFAIARHQLRQLSLYAPRDSDRLRASQILLTESLTTMEGLVEALLAANISPTQLMDYFREQWEKQQQEQLNA